MLDLDRFKRIDDAFGHAAGDFVLREFARLARENLRSGELIGRWGGEEFLLVMPDTPLDVALGAVERIRTMTGLIQGGQLPAGYAITLSAAIASDEGRASTFEDLVAERSFDASATVVRRNIRSSGVGLATGRQPVTR